MTTLRPTTTLDDQPVPVRATLAAAWTSFMFLYAYVDILNFFTPGVVADILEGRVFEFDLSQTFSTAALALVSVPAFMVVGAVVSVRLSPLPGWILRREYMAWVCFVEE